MTLATDLLVGIAADILLELAIHCYSAPVDVGQVSKVPGTMKSCPT